MQVYEAFSLSLSSATICVRTGALSLRPARSRPRRFPHHQLRHRSPTHFTDETTASAVVVAADPIVSSGTRHSCRLNPPCEYSRLVLKAPTPGGTAMWT